MIHKKLSQIPEFLAGDRTRLKEVLHPTNDQLHLGFSLAHAYLNVGEKSLPHRLAHSETYYFLQGEGIIYVAGAEKTVEKNDVVYVAPNAEQYVVNTGKDRLEFLCIVSPPWSAETEEIDG
ncbi:MAG: cupin domain-containing protein [Bacteroidota bacterium]